MTNLGIMSEMRTKIRRRISEDFGLSAVITMFEPRHVVTKNENILFFKVVVQLSSTILYGYGSTENEIIESLKTSLNDYGANAVRVQYVPSEKEIEEMCGV